MGDSLGYIRLSAMLWTNEMGQAGGIGIVAATWYGGPGARTFVRQIGEISSTMR